MACNKLHAADRHSSGLATTHVLTHVLIRKSDTLVEVFHWLKRADEPIARTAAMEALEWHCLVVVSWATGSNTKLDLRLYYSTKHCYHLIGSVNREPTVVCSACYASCCDTLSWLESTRNSFCPATNNILCCLSKCLLSCFGSAFRTWHSSRS